MTQRPSFATCYQRDSAKKAGVPTSEPEMLYKDIIGLSDFLDWPQIIIDNIIQIFQKTWVMPKFSKFQIHPWQTESVDFVLLDVPEMNHLVVKLKEFQSFVLLGIVSFGDQICGAG